MMRHLVPTLSMATLVAFAACGDSGTEVPPVDRVEVTPDEAALGALGETVRFEAQALDLSAAPLDDLDYEWESSDPAVATVDQNGEATAVSVGEAFIRATTQGVTGEARLSVRECGAPVSLGAGEWLSVDLPGENECGVVLPSGSSGDRYRVAIVRTRSDESGSDVPTVSLRVTALGGVAAAGWSETPAGPTDRQRSGAPPLRAPSASIATAQVVGSTARAHVDMRERERRMLEAIDAAALLPSLGVEGPARAAQATSPDRIMVDPTTPTFCTPAGTQTPAFKVAENDDIVIYQDSAQADGDLAITSGQAQQMLQYYRTHGKPIIEDYFAGLSDIDGNGKVIVVVHPVVSGNTAAFVWSGDFFPKTQDGESFCPASNEAEMVFFNADLIQRLDEAVFQALETLVHEVKHVSSLYKSIARGERTGVSGYHPGWIEEGSAEIAGNMSARRAWSTVGGPAPNVALVEQHIRDFAIDGPDLRPEFYGIFLRLFRTQGYLVSQPNSVVTDPLGADADHSIYGSGWVFLRWLGDAYGNAAASAFADAAFFREQNDSLSPVGVAGLEAVTGRTFSQLMVEYSVAVMLNGTGATPPQRAFTSYDFPSAIELWCFAADNPPCDGLSAGPVGSFPWPVTTRSNGTMFRPYADDEFSGGIGPAGLRVHEFSSDGAGVDAEILVSAPSGSRVVVVRVR